MGGKGRRRVAVTVAVAATLAVTGLAAAAGSWQVVPVTAAAGSTASGLSFDGTADGWLVGSIPQQPGYSNLGKAPLTERWNGSTWSAVTAPDTKFYDDTLNAVAALSPTNAWAVGQHKRTGFKSPVTPFVLHWNGSSWSEVATPTLAFTRASLSAIAAVSASDIWAVGTTFTGGPLIEHWNGAAWSVMNGPTVTGGSLTGVSATGPNDVWAVGSVSARTLVEHWNGTAWAVVASPNAPAQAPGVAASDLLTSVTAVAPNDAWAVGYTIDVQSGSLLPLKTLTEHWNGSAWSIVASPSTKGHNVLMGVRALGSGDVWAVGSGWTDQATGVPVETPELLHWNGASWTAVAPPANVGASDNFLSAVTSVGTTVWAAGTGSNAPLLLRGP
jgi:hypothetical protein